MLNQSNHTALLLFSRSAAAEARNKKIFRRARHNQKAAKGFIHHTIQIASQCGLPWQVCDEHSQTGNSFGEKLANAITQTFSKGYSKLLVIGNDCPALTTQDIQKAAADLEEHDMVLGPTVKGGVYLIGVTAATFNKQAFENIRWQTPSVCLELKALAKNSTLAITCLPVLNDINTSTDIIAFAKKFSAIYSWPLVLLQYALSNIVTYFYSNTLSSYNTVSAAHRRGPPIFCN